MDKAQELRELDNQVKARQLTKQKLDKDIHVADKRKIVALNALEDLKLEIGHERKKNISAKQEVAVLVKKASDTESQVNADCDRIKMSIDEAETAAHKAQDEQKKAIKEQDKARSEQKKLKQDKIDHVEKVSELAQERKEFNERLAINEGVDKAAEKRFKVLADQEKALHAKIDEAADSVTKANDARDQYAAKTAECDVLIAENEVLNKGLKQAEKDALQALSAAKQAVSEANADKQKYSDRQKVLNLAYDELDKQKDAFKVTELRVRKLVKDKGIKDELERLEKALAK